MGVIEIIREWLFALSVVYTIRKIETRSTVTILRFSLSFFELEVLELEGERGRESCGCAVVRVFCE